MLSIHSHSESVVRGRNRMRGQVDPQGSMFSYFSVEERIPADHPLRRVKAQADAVLGTMSAQFDAMYASVGRPSIAPERLLKATLLIALYSVRSDRLDRKSTRLNSSHLGISYAV